jgi:hypothetical protein
MAILQLQMTARFSVLDAKNADLKSQYPRIDLEDLLLHGQRQATQQVTKQLWDAFQTYGFCLLSTQGCPAGVVSYLYHSLHEKVFPVSNNEKNVAGLKLKQSTTVYLSEKNVPLYRLGYELCSDGVREAFRIATGDPDETPWLDSDMRRTWLRTTGLMRDITDTALDLLLLHQESKGSKTTTRHKRPFSGRKTWLEPDFFTQNPLPERRGEPVP